MPRRQLHRILRSTPAIASSVDPVGGSRPCAMETFAVDGFPETKLVLALFKNVKNASDLKSKHLNRVALLDAGS